MRICAFGELGTGKTLSVVYHALKWKKNHPNATIYSNIPIKPDHVKLNSPEIIFDIKKDSIVILDELWHLADSRRSMSVINDIMNMLLLRSRKKNWFVGYTQQHWRQTDLRIRFVTELWIEPQMAGTSLLMKYYNKEGIELGQRVINGSNYWNLYKTEADPYTLDIEHLKEKWKQYRKKNL